MLLKVENLKKVYGSEEYSLNALRGITLEVKSGEFVSIMGPSGCGKSTFMHIIGCLDTPTSGKVILEGKDISKLSEIELAKIRNKRIGFVFQSFNLIPRMDAITNVQLPLFYSGVPAKERRERALKALEEVGLAKRINHFSNQLSGGEQQRVAIARALINNPAIIFADEPTGNLDSKAGREIMDIFKSLHKKGNTIIMVTHDRSVAKMTQRIIRMKDGLVIN